MKVLSFLFPASINFSPMIHGLEITTQSVEKEQLLEVKVPLWSNVCWDVELFVGKHSKTRCADQPYLMAVGCVFLCAY